MDAYFACLRAQDSCGDADSDILNFDVCGAGSQCDADVSTLGCPTCAMMPVGVLFVRIMCPLRCQMCGASSSGAPVSNSAPLTVATLPNVARAHGQQFASLIALFSNGSISDKWDRPVTPGTNRSSTVVAVTWGVRHISSLNLMAGTFSISGDLAMWWQDPRMTWDPKDYGGAALVQIDGELPFVMWSPEIGFDVIVQKPQVISSFTQIYSNGLVMRGHKAIFTVSCVLNFQQYPFDKQVCPVKLESQHVPSSEISYRLPTAAEGQKAFEMSVAHHRDAVGDFLIGPPKVQSVESIYYGLAVSGIEYTFKFDRIWTKAVSTIFAPIWCVMVLSFIGLFIQDDKVPAKAALATIPMLTLISLMFTITRNLPPAPTALNIEIYFICNLILTVLNSMEFAFVNVVLTRLERHRAKVEDQEALIEAGGHHLHIIGCDAQEADQREDDAESQPARRSTPSKPLPFTVEEAKKRWWETRERIAWRADLQQLVHALEFLGGGHLQAAELTTSLMKLGLTKGQAAPLAEAVPQDSHGRVHARQILTLLEATDLVKTHRPRSIVLCGKGISKRTVRKWGSLYSHFFAPAYFIILHLVWFLTVV